MKISAARLYRRTQPFIDLPYICRGQSETGFDSAIVALEAEDGTVGWGEAAPLGAFYSEAFQEGIRAGITLQDLLTPHTDGVISGVSLKVGRVGGVGPTRLLRDLAVALGLKVTVEDVGGSTISTAATALLMVSMPEKARTHTVDFMNWGTVGNAAGMPETRDGLLVAPDGPGLGISVDPDRFGAPVASF